MIFFVFQKKTLIGLLGRARRCDRQKSESSRPPLFFFLHRSAVSSPYPSARRYTDTNVGVA